MIYARSIVKPNAIETCGIWPYEKDDEEYPEFIIEELPNGEYRRFSCRESGLANYFGGNPGSPHYLTPIFFKPSVLDKYRRDTVFTVSERRITCGAQWGVEIDNVNPDRVMVFLGDIGRDLPEAERKHFLQYEMSPINQAISREVYANDFLSLWTEATGPITKFLNAHNKLNKTWESSFGWLLYREYHPEDENIQQQIRIPSSNGQEEFDTVILSLAKMVVDYIDEAKLQSSQTGSINKLEDFLNQHNISVDLSAIRNLQSLRSSGIAHSKGGKYESLRDSLLTGNSIDNAKAIIAKLTEFLISLSLVLENENQEA
jgi:hypothetical protein